MKMSEFSKLSGIKRTTLQLYDQKGLLHPIPSSRNGYWEYSEDALGDAMLITVLKEAGYELKRISEILETQDDLQEIMKDAVKLIRERIERLEGCIRYINMLQLTAENQYLIQPILSKVNITEVLKKSGGYKNEINEYIRLTKENPAGAELRQSNQEDEEDEDPEFTWEMKKIIQVLSYIPLMIGKEPPEGPTVQETLRRVFEHTEKLAKDYDDDTVTRSEFAEFIIEMAGDLSEDETGWLKETLGEGSIDYLLQAVKTFEGNSK